MCIERIETIKTCRYCQGVGFDLGEPRFREHSAEADIIPCKPCGSTGKEVDYYYVITYKNRKFIVDTLK